MKTLPRTITLGVAAVALATTALTGCSGDDGSTAKDSTKPSADQSTEPADPPTVGTYPELEAQDYSFVLEQQCFCPLTGPVKITVQDGKVTSAVVTKGGNGIKKGSDAPEYLRITLNDVIAAANNTEADQVDVDWPDGQDWPDRVAVDPDKRAADEEITYVVSDVELS